MIGACKLHKHGNSTLNTTVPAEHHDDLKTWKAGEGFRVHLTPQWAPHSNWDFAANAVTMLDTSITVYRYRPARFVGVDLTIRVPHGLCYQLDPAAFHMASVMPDVITVSVAVMQDALSRYPHYPVRRPVHIRLDAGVVRELDHQPDGETNL